jgi:hypothetical protein
LFLSNFGIGDCGDNDIGGEDGHMLVTTVGDDE